MTEREEENKSKLAKLERELGLVERQLELIKLIDNTKEDIRREEQQNQNDHRHTRRRTPSEHQSRSQARTKSIVFEGRAPSSQDIPLNLLE